MISGRLLHLSGPHQSTLLCNEEVVLNDLGFV